MGFGELCLGSVGSTAVSQCWSKTLSAWPFAFYSRCTHSDVLAWLTPL